MSVLPVPTTPFPTKALVLPTVVLIITEISNKNNPHGWQGTAVTELRVRIIFKIIQIHFHFYHVNQSVKMFSYLT